MLFLYLISEIPEFLTLQVSKNVIPFYFPIEAKTGLSALKNKKGKIFSNLNYFVYATIKIFYKIKYILRISLILADAVPYYHHYIVRSLANVVPCFLELSNKVKCFKSFVRVSRKEYRCRRCDMGKLRCKNQVNYFVDYSCDWYQSRFRDPRVVAWCIIWFLIRQNVALNIHLTRTFLTALCLYFTYKCKTYPTARLFYHKNHRNAEKIDLLLWFEDCKLDDMYRDFLFS